MINKIVDTNTAISKIKDGMTVMIGGFACCGCAHRLIDALSKSNVKDLTLISTDASKEDKDIVKLFLAKKVKKMIVSHMGLNKEANRQMVAGECEIELIPMGTLVERIRCAGVGLGGFLTNVGIGTVAQEGKQVINLNGRDYIIEEPLKADVALISATLADEYGNLFYKGTSRNSNPIMAMAADIVIAESPKICKIGEIEKECIHTAGIFVDYIVRSD